MSLRKKGKAISKEKFISKVKLPSIPFPRKTSLKSVSKAKKNALLLEKDFRESNSREEKKAIKRKVILAANRADKKGKKRGISEQKKREYGKIAKLYRNSYQQMILEEIGSKPEEPAVVFSD